MKLLKVNVYKNWDKYTNQTQKEFKFCFTNIRTINLSHYLQAPLVHPTSQTHGHDTCIKHTIHHPIGRHASVKNSVRFDIPRIVNNCPK